MAGLGGFFFTGKAGVTPEKEGLTRERRRREGDGLLVHTLGAEEGEGVFRGDRGTRG